MTEKDFNSVEILKMTRIVKGKVCSLRRDKRKLNVGYAIEDGAIIRFPGRFLASCRT
jgi:hypothetical protein